MNDLGLSARQLARTAGVSANTVLGLIHGRTWPIATTRVLIEQAIGWPTGEIYRRAVEETSRRTTLSQFSARELLLELLNRDLAHS